MSLDISIQKGHEIKPFNWVDKAQDRDYWGALVNEVVSNCIHLKSSEILLSVAQS